jgi:hypothetical protein
MARLSDADASRLVERLTEASVVAPRETEGDDEPLRHALGALAASGDLGPLLGHRLAAYLHRPVRCTSGVASETQASRTTYAASAQPGVWISIDTMLAAAIADAMIGGDGDPARTGVSRRVTRVAANAAAEMLAALSEALGVKTSLGVEQEPDRATLGPALGGGSMIVGSQEFGWFAGLRRAPKAQAIDPQMTARRTEREQETAAPVARRGSLAVALEAARAACEHALRTHVAFGDLRARRETPANLPFACINLGMPVPAGTVVLSIDRRTTSLVLAASTRTDAREDELGALARAGVETIATNVLYAFVDALTGSDANLRHALALTDAAILAAAPHDAIEHEVTIGRDRGTFRWLVPSDLPRRDA